MVTLRIQSVFLNKDLTEIFHRKGNEITKKHNDELRNLCCSPNRPIIMLNN
jgi:hypothetical protein